jgi:hypothetical protein
MFEKWVGVWELRTRLGINGCEQSGPEKAAEALLEYFNQKLTHPSYK